MGEIVRGLDRERIAALQSAGRFFWVDVRAGDVSRENVAQALGVPDRALDPLLDFSEHRPPSRRFHADGRDVVFVFTTFTDTGTIEVHVLVSGDYLLTVHEAPASLPDLLDPLFPEGRSEQYLIYSVLDAMVATAFDRLSVVGDRLEDLQDETAVDMRGGSVRMRDLRAITVDLSRLRRQIAPQRGTFERVSEEIDAVEGLESDSNRYFERIAGQLTRLVEGIDASSNAAANLVELRLNETTYWLTVVATVFLPLTFVTGFFGMNFAWMVDHIDTFVAFLVLGVGGCLLGASLTVFAVRRRGTPVDDSD